MTSVAEHERSWARAKAELTAAASALGFPEELADLLARELRSPGAMARMAAYLRMARPRSMEMIADELLAIRGELDAWQAKKDSETAQAGYSLWLQSDRRRRMAEEEE